MSVFKNTQLYSTRTWYTGK